jgi:hypothetical protein
MSLPDSTPQRQAEAITGIKLSHLGQYIICTLCSLVNRKTLRCTDSSGTGLQRQISCTVFSRHAPWSASQTSRTPDSLSSGSSVFVSYNYLPLAVFNRHLRHLQQTLFIAQIKKAMLTFQTLSTCTTTRYGTCAPI